MTTNAHNRQNGNSPRWEEPPTGGPGRGRAAWVERLTPLMAEPGRWAVVASYPLARRSAASTMRSNLTRGLVLVPAGKWEFVSRSTDTEANVYARYIGPE